MNYTLNCDAYPLRPLPNCGIMLPQEGVLDTSCAAYLNRAVRARKAGDADGEKGYHFFDNFVSGIRTADMFISKRYVAVLPLLK